MLAPLEGHPLLTAQESILDNARTKKIVLAHDLIIVVKVKQ
jgi:hypothetical protein